MKYHYLEGVRRELDWNMVANIVMIIAFIISLVVLWDWFFNYSSLTISVFFWLIEATQ